MSALRRLTAAIALLLLGAMPAFAEDAPAWSISTSVNYWSGDYGTGKDTTIVSLPFTLGVMPLDRLWLHLTVPFIHQTTQNVVLTGGGVARRNEGRGRLARPATSTTEDGVGDVLLKVSYVLIEEQPLFPETAPFVKLKFPTADEDRGLGTGEFDETVGVDLSKGLIAGLSGYLSLFYTFIGDPPGTDLRDSFGWSLGAAYAVIQPLSVFAFLEGATAIARGQEDPLEFRVGAELKFTKALRLTGSVMRGLSDGSADWGFSAGLTVRF